jgi:hypothetical protein
MVDFQYVHPTPLFLACNGIKAITRIKFCTGRITI